jgi:MarR family transcriptional repressor of emrRAB
VTLDQAGNRIGALALVVTDRVMDATGGAAGLSVSDATALSALHHFLDHPTVDLLRQVLGLTSSGTVRLVDRLVGAGYVRRAGGDDGRSTRVSLTPSGRRAAARVSNARADVLGDALSVLSPAERRQLDALTARLLVGLMREPGATRWMCRLCDTHACGRDVDDCPVANEARRRFPVDSA